MDVYGAFFVAASAFTFTTKFPTQASGRSSRERRKIPSEKQVKLTQKKSFQTMPNFPFCFCSFHFLVAPFSNISQQM